jgi:hypothetical protein
MDKTQVRELIIRPALIGTKLWSANAEELLMGTAAQESKFFTYVKQVGVSGATAGGLGPFQMEEPTFTDLWNRLVSGKNLESRIMTIFNFNITPFVSTLMRDFSFAAVMCRIKYLDVAEALPDASNVPAMAAYWKKYYNTPLGAGTEQEFIDNYHRYVA